MEKYISNDRLLSTSPNYSITQYLLLILGAYVTLWLVKSVRRYLNYMKSMTKIAENFEGPPTIPLFGNALPLAKDVDNSLNYIMNLGKLYPTTYRAWLGPQLVIVISGPKDLEIIYNSPKASTKAFVYKFMEPACLNALINGSGPQMKLHRRLIIPFINAKSVLDCYILSFNKHTKKFVKTLAKKENSGEFDIYKLMESFMADMMFETLFGIPETAEIDSNLLFPKAMNEILNVLYQRIVSPWLHPRYLFNLSLTGYRWRQCTTAALQFLDKIIASKKKIYTALEKGEPITEKPKLSVLDLVVENAVKTGAWDDEEIRGDMVSAYFGSNDTISTIISFVLLMLAMHPKIQDKVRDEVLDVVGSDDVHDEHMGQLKYTEMALKETIRLFPAGGITAREITDDLEIENHTLPKGTTVMLITYATHRSEKYWIEPDKFNPERFTPENSKDRHPYAFIPFSAGQRGCPGYKFGIRCLKVIISHLIRDLEFETTMKLETLRLKTHIAVCSRDGYRVSVKKLNRQAMC